MCGFALREGARCPQVVVFVLDRCELGPEGAAIRLQVVTALLESAKLSLQIVVHDVVPLVEAQNALILSVVG